MRNILLSIPACTLALYQSCAIYVSKNIQVASYLGSVNLCKLPCSADLTAINSCSVWIRMCYSTCPHLHMPCIHSSKPATLPVTQLYSQGRCTKSFIGYTDSLCCILVCNEWTWLPHLLVLIGITWLVGARGEFSQTKPWFTVATLSLSSCRLWYTPWPTQW